MQFCRYCHHYCGEREFCDETCYHEHERETMCFLEDREPADEINVGDLPPSHEPEGD